MPVKGEELKKVTRLSYGAGFVGVIWFIVASPQQIWSIFLTNQLGATSSQLGIIVGMTQVVAFLHLSSIYFYSRLKRVKLFWIITTVIHRFLSLGLAFAAFYVYRGGDKTLAMVIVALSTVMSLALANTSSAGWFTWMSRLIPRDSRASFFGKRSAINQMSNVIFFFSITWILDRFDDKILIVYGIIFILGSFLGMLDILLHIGIPELLPKKKKISFSLQDMITPLKNRTFLIFCGVMGFSIMAINVTAPFIAPWIVSVDKGLGAPTIWIGIMVVISQTTWVLTAPFWGKVMDRLGKKGVVMIGSIFPLFWLFYLLASPSNYFFIIPLIALLSGLITPAFYDGLLQITYSLSDEDNQTAYIAWHWASFGLFGAIGPAAGGKILDWSHYLTGQSAGYFSHGIYVNVIISAGLTLTGLLVYSILKLKETPARNIIRIVMNPGIFRTMNSISVIEREKKSPIKVQSSLRNISGKSGLLAEPEIIERLNDPDRDVREEAARTLGRIGSEEAINALIDEFNDEDSTLRIVASRVLGRSGNSRAIPFLIGGLADKSDEIQEACAEALGDMDEDDSVDTLLDMMRLGKSEKVKVSGAIALSKKGRRDAAGDIFKLMKSSQNRVFRKQLAIALSNMLAKPGKFYIYLQGNWDDSFLKLYEECNKLINSLLKKSAPHLLIHLSKEILPSIKEDYNQDNYNAVMLGQKKLLMELSYTIYQKNGKQRKEENLRMLLWYFNLYEGAEVGELDILLSFYAIVYGQYLYFM